MKLVKDPLIGKVTFDGKYIYNEGIETYSFAVGVDSYFDDDADIESTKEKLIAQLHASFHRPKTAYYITSITLSYGECTWTLI